MPVSARGDSKVLVGVDYYPEQWPRARWPIDAKLMADAGEHGAVIGWQIDNEFACHRGGCFCEECRTTFQRWLQRRYGSLEHLNETWGTAFWSQTYTAWEQIPLPARTVAVHNPALRLDFQR